MTKYFIWIAGLRGPQPQLCYDEPVDGAGKPKPNLAIHPLDDNDKRDLKALVLAYPPPGDAP